MFESNHSPKHQSRQVYDYLLGDNSRSQQKYFSSKKPIDKHSVQKLLKTPEDREKQLEYQLIVEFQLRREKEKNIILEERLRNKESFIKQMKEFQDQLTIAFEKCQEQLQYYKAQCQQYESKWNSFATFNNNKSLLTQNINESVGEPSKVDQLVVREYLQEIAELKHLVIRLQEQINIYQKKQKLYQENKLYHQNKLHQQGKNLSMSVQKDFYNSRKHKNVQSRQITQESPTRKDRKYKLYENHKKQQRSKTLANQFVQEKLSENLDSLTKISNFILQQNSKISSFLNHFLMMCEFFEPSIQKESSIKHKLKKAWKWVKTAIVEWNHLKKQKIQKIKEYKIGNIVTSLLPLTNLNIEEITALLQKMLKLPQQEKYVKRQ